MTTDTTYHLSLSFDRPIFSEMTKIESADDINNYIREIIQVGYINHKEHFWALPLTRSHRILGICEISSGKTDMTCVPIKTVIQLALLSNATGLVLIHNHPSGKLEPSKSDIAITERIKKALDLIDVTVLDHLIITQESYFSFHQNDLL